ncbi:hypothetical protein IW262DRAFT_1299921 [Armillaria fumosa]|nr:hypothetical protein IW262DRAFT_1299921 [Armillaria fumosa]
MYSPCLTHPSHGRPSLKHKVSYGELSAEEVESVVAPSDVDDTDLSSNSLIHRGHVLFVDDEASKALQASKEPSGSEEDNRSKCDAAYVHPGSLWKCSSCLQRSKVKTVKGSYMDDLQGDQHKWSSSPVYLEDLECMVPKS